MTAGTRAGASAPLVTPELLGEVADAVGLREGPAGVRTVIREVGRREPVSVRDLARAVGLPLPIVAAVCQELRSRSVISDERPVQLTEAARAELARSTSPDVGVCSTCWGRGVTVPDDLWPIVEYQAEVEAASPMVRVELDQAHCTPETAVRRALLLAEEGALEGGRVLLLGDDDLLSVAISSVAHHLGLAGPDHLVVLDVDPELVAFLESCHTLDSASPATAGGTGFEARVHDLRDPLPADLVGEFEAVVTDPPYTAAGIALFGSRAASALVPAAGGQLFVSFGSTRPDVISSAQADLLAMGFGIRSLTPDFNDYIGTGALAGSSAMYHLRSTGPPVPIIAGRHEGDLYTSDGRHRPRGYVCRSCGRHHLVGPGQAYPTIAELQVARCECGADRFEPGPRTTPDP